ncbi:MAG: M14 metallopeptidase family protein [Gemmatimonadales bacterium]
MQSNKQRIHLSLGLALLAAMPLAAQVVPAPETVLGFVPGTDRKLVEWPVLVEYYQQLANASDRVEYHELGKTTLGAPFVALVISSAENMARLPEIRAINLQLADPRLIDSDIQRERLLADGKTIVLITSSIHSTEVGGHLSPTIIAHRLATESTPKINEILDNTVLLLVPSLNPDGVTIVSRWYNETLDTPAEGSGPPELYHHYVGHDNNRDWYAFTQVETQLTIDSLHNYWHPQIVHDIHQMGSTGARFFLPPFLDPIEPNVDPLIVQGYNTLGTHMAWELTGQGKQGIVVNATYDAWTPARSYQHHHAGVRILSETASARLATPIELSFDMLRGRRGFDARQSSWNFIDPWPGGVWRLADIVDYQSSGAIALLSYAATNRDIWLSNFLKIGERAVAGWEEWPYAYVIPADQPNQIGLNAMLRIFQRGMVEVRIAESDFTAGGTSHQAGTYVVVLQQPYASFAKALLERQEYPDLRQYPGGPPRAPYDVTAHTLPLLFDVEVSEVVEPFDVPLSDPVTPPVFPYRYDRLSRETNEGGLVGLYKSYAASMDEGWTRWIFDTWDIPHESVEDAAVRAGELAGYDAIIIPDMDAESIVSGLDPTEYPEAFAGGIGAGGVESLKSYVEAGGTLVVFNEAANFAIEAFDLPIRNVLENFDAQEFYAPGTLFRMDLDTTNAMTENMSSRAAAWFQRSPAFEFVETDNLRAVARYPVNPDSILLSGWVLHPERLSGKVSLVEAHVGAGRVVLFGFRPQYRAQSIGTYPLFFNALKPRRDTSTP